MSLTNPLYHAREAQSAFDATFAECAEQPSCAAAFPDLARKFAEVLTRLEQAPVVEIGAAAGRAVVVELDRVGFAEGIRTTMYSMPRARSIPWLVQRAWEGDYSPITEATIHANVGIRDALMTGMLLSVVCSEDVPRIDPNSIDEATRGTFLGDHRVRTQMAACDSWPRAEVPAGYGDPVAVDVATLLWSGTLDPVTGPRWGAEAARHLSRSLHLVVAGAHGVRNPCTESISRQFLARGTIHGLDTACIDSIRLPAFPLGR